MAGTIQKRRFWTDAERDLMRRLYPVSTARAVARRLGRSARSVYNQALLLGLATQRRIDTGPMFLAEVRRLNAEGLPDSEIADRLDCERHTVSHHRNAMGLPSNARGERYRAKVKDRTARQCREAGVETLAEVRVLAFRNRAVSVGWPPETRPREVQILDALSERGAMTRREIADAIGMPWVGSRVSLKCRGGRGSYLANLIAAGLVVSLGRVVRGSGSGYSTELYTLSLCTERTVV